MKNIGEIYGEPNLAPNPGAGDVFASEQTEIECHAFANRVLAPDQHLELASAQVPIIRKSTVSLDAERQAGIDVVKNREACGVNMAARGLNAQSASAGVAGEQIANVRVDPGPVGERLSSDEREPVVGQSGAELMVGISSRKLDVQAGGQCGNAGALDLLVEVPLHSQVCVARAGGSLSSQDAKDREIWGIDIELQVVRQAVVEFIVGGVLPDAGVLMLQSVKFIEELKVPLSALGDRRVIRVEGELGHERRRNAERTGQRQDCCR